MIRVLCLMGGLTGAIGLSQYPEFSQQYIQRLAGQVDALTIEARRFDDSALAEGMGWRAAIEFAVKAASISVTRMGAQASVPERSDI